MFSPRYFTHRYFPTRYFPKTGGVGSEPDPETLLAQVRVTCEAFDYAVDPQSHDHVVECKPL